jgi:hypothetical protein
MIIGKQEVTGWVFRPSVNERFPYVVENRGVGGLFAYIMVAHFILQQMQYAMWVLFRWEDW